MTKAMKTSGICDKMVQSLPLSENGNVEMRQVYFIILGIIVVFVLIMIATNISGLYSTVRAFFLEGMWSV